MKPEKTKKKRILEILLDYKPHRGTEFVPITYRFGAVLYDLRDVDGYKIDTLYLDGRNKPAWYQLVAVAAA